jgi:oligopeptide/dipeptide ABC transporter ATP-binding protein
VTGTTLQAEPILQVEGLCKHYGARRSLFRAASAPIRAVDGVDFAILPGETFGLVGESGCGKTTLGRCVARALDPTSGRILYRRKDQPGEEETVDLATLSPAGLRPYRRDLQMIFQDPITSLNPRMSLLDIIGEPIAINGIAKGKAIRDMVADLLEQVGLRADHMTRYPHAFSGGQRQRIGIARALSLSPRFIVCDEPVSALDVSVQAQILNLLQDLQRSRQLTYLFIAHDLGVIEYICDRVAVMYVGQVVELATNEALFSRPLHPYTEALMAAVPVPDPTARREAAVLEGELANAVSPPSGCTFHPRCRYRTEACVATRPALRELEPGHFVRCHRAEELTLAGPSDYESGRALP